MRASQDITKATAPKNFVATLIESIMGDTVVALELLRLEVMTRLHTGPTLIRIIHFNRPRTQKNI